MLEGIREIGKEAIKSGEFLENLALPLQPERKKGQKQYKQHVIIINIDTKNKTIKFIPAEVNNITAKEFLWIGNTSPQPPQDRLTTTSLVYAISQVIPTLAEALPDSNLKQQCEFIKDNYFYDMGKQNGQKERYRYILDIEKLHLTNKTMSGIKDEIKDKKNLAKKMADFVAKEVQIFIKDELSISKDEIALHTIQIDGKSLVNDKAYKDYLIKRKIEEPFRDVTNNICHVCGNKGEITPDTTQLSFKYYMTDKIGFSSDIKGKKGFIKNFAICKNCYQSIMAGEAFIKNNLRTYLAETNVYIIPKFLFPTEGVIYLDKWSKYIIGFFNSAVSLENLKKFEQYIQEYLEYEDEKNNYILNILFYKQRQSEFKILKVIKDVPPSRIEELKGVASDIKDIADGILGEDNRWYLSLGAMYYLFPVRKKQNEVDNKKVLEFYDALISGKPVSYLFLINEFVRLVKVYYFEEFNQYNINKGNFIHPILQANLLLLYLRKLNLLRGGEKMGIEGLNLREDIKDFIDKIGYSEEKTALFLLGYLIAEVANAQYKDGIENKPILDKVTYQGMNRTRLIRLVNDVFEKLRQYNKKYKVLQYNEGLFAEMKKLMDKNIDIWNLTDTENVFYCLSGYAYDILKVLRYSKEKQNKEEE
jgi:CRISPR-associated protein Csh1